jgi:uncharacterized membrane protein YidH (DUF202 family)
MNAVNRTVNEVTDASPSKWIERLARLGFAAKGLVYVIIGFLAIKTGLGSTQQVEDSGGALQTLVNEPFGKAMLILVGIGLIGYAVWRFIQAVKDPEHEGTDAKGIIKRVGYGISGFLHASLAITAFSLSRGGRAGDGDAKAQDWTARLMEQPFGRFLVIAVGAIIIIWAIREFVAAYRAKFMRKMERPDVSPKTLDILRTIGRVGYASRGVVSLIIGFFLLMAGIRYDSSQAKGLQGALESLLQQPYGPYLLALVGLGLIAYGIFQFVNARYRLIRPVM